jgi:hypothetical protein
MRYQLNRAAWIVYLAYDRYISAAFNGKKHPTELAHPDQVLKVFVLPEFYFRPQGVPREGHGAYTEAENIELMTALEQMVNQPRCADWLFIFGTVIVKKTRSAFDPNLHDVLLNQAFIVPGNNPRGSRIVAKSYTSHIDGVDLSEHPEVHTAAMVRSKFALENHVLADYGLGLEICLEHAYGVLKDTAKRMRGASVKIHVLTAGGMPTQKQMIASANKGSFYRCDGHISCTHSTELYKDSNSYYDCLEIDSVDLPVGKQLRAPPNAYGSDFSNFEQKIVFYPTR